jgi:SAM-dependent methyltransferase
VDVKEVKLYGDRLSSHWYYVSKGQALLAMLRGESFSRVLDIGAGSGIFAKLILSRTTAREATCLDINYDHAEFIEYAGKQLNFVRGEENLTPFAFDLVLLMDVLEHVRDDAAFLKSFVDQASSGTRFLITVPAFQFLVSSHDVFLEHERRYSLSQLERLLKGVGLRIRRTSFFLFFLLIPIWCVRLLQKFRMKLSRRSFKPASDLKAVSFFLNRLFIMINLLERVLVFRFNRLAGLTIFAYAVKP